MPERDVAHDVLGRVLGLRVVPGSVFVGLPVDNDVVQTEFLAKVLQTDRQKYIARWTKKTFREGLPAPLSKGSDAAVIAFVRATPGAVGYISGKAHGVKLLEKF